RPRPALDLLREDYRCAAARRTLPPATAETRPRPGPVWVLSLWKKASLAGDPAGRIVIHFHKRAAKTIQPKRQNRCGQTSVASCQRTNSQEHQRAQGMTPVFWLQGVGCYIHRDLRANSCQETWQNFDVPTITTGVSLNSPNNAFLKI